MAEGMQAADACAVASRDQAEGGLSPRAGEQRVGAALGSGPWQGVTYSHPGGCPFPCPQVVGIDFGGRSL